jgi:hypothetical protein
MQPHEKSWCCIDFPLYFRRLTFTPIVTRRNNRRCNPQRAAQIGGSVLTQVQLVDWRYGRPQS